MDTLTRSAIATTAGVCGAVFGALWLGLEDPYWAGLSALIIANVDRTALFTKGVLRVVGTAAGVGGGYFVAQTLEGVPLFQFLALVGAAGFGTYMRQRSPFAYAWFYGALSLMLMIACSMTTPAEIYTFAHYRCYEIVLGVVAATLANWALGPRKEGQHLALARAPVVFSVPEALRGALAAGLGSGAIALAWGWFDLPSFTQVLVSSLVVIDRDLETTAERARQRLLGCLIGGVAGLGVLAANADNPVWWGASLAAGIYLSARVHLDRVRYAYVGTQAAVAFLVTLVDTGPPTSIEPPFDRLVGILIGVAVMEATVWLVARSWPLTPAASAHTTAAAAPEPATASPPPAAAAPPADPPHA